MCGKFCLVSTGMSVEAVSPGFRDKFYKVFIARSILSQDDEVSAGVAFVGSFRQQSVGYIHFAAYYQSEASVLDAFYSVAHLIDLGLITFALRLFKSFFIAFQASAVHVIVDFLDSEHISMVGYGNTCHAVVERLVYQGGD